MSRFFICLSSALRCATGSRVPLAFRVLLAVSVVVWGGIFMYFRGEHDNNMVYVASQCMWKSYANLEQYSKSGRVFPCVSSILQQAPGQHGGFFDANFPTDKVGVFGFAFVARRCVLGFNLVVDTAVAAGDGAQLHALVRLVCTCVTLALALALACGLC